MKKVILMLGFIASIAGLEKLSLSAQFGSPRPEQTEQQRQMEQQRDKEANLKRQEEIRQDTQKLYQLASELKDAVDKTNEHVLSLDVVKKADEVEKLAKRVKERMKEGVGKTMTPEPPPLPTPSHPPPFGPN